MAILLALGHTAELAQAPCYVPSACCDSRANPASRNAGLQLAPERPSTLATLRTASLQIGSIVTVAIATAILAHFVDSGGVQAWVYAVVAALLVAALPLVTHVPEHHGSW